MQRRGPSDWTDLIGELLPIIITVLIGLLALTKRLVDGVFRRKAAEAAAKPKPPLNEEVRRFLEEMERDRRGLFGDRRADEDEKAKEEAEAEAAARAEAESPPRRPAPPPPVVREPRAEPEALAPRAPTLALSRPRAVAFHATSVVAPASEVTRRRSAARGTDVRGFDLRRALVWAEILAAPIALRDGAGFAPGGEPLPPPPAGRG